MTTRGTGAAEGMAVAGIEEAAATLVVAETEEGPAAGRPGSREAALLHGLMPLLRWTGIADGSYVQ